MTNPVTTLLVATGNAGKLREIEAILAGRFARLISMAQAGISLAVEETGRTFEENALLKAQALANHCRCAVLADDSGLCVDALAGAPGIYSARYAGSPCDDGANNAKLIHALRAVPQSHRGARYVCAAALVRPGCAPIIGRGECAGMIIDIPAGSGGFGYDPYFYLLQMGQTMAQLTDAQKNAISHRRFALEDVLTQLTKEDTL